MNAVTNEWLLEASRWLVDFFLLATLLLAVVLILDNRIAQPARRMAIHWSTAVGLLLLALLCALPGWSIMHPFPGLSELPSTGTESLEPVAGLAVQMARLEPPPGIVLPPGAASSNMSSTPSTTTSAVAHQVVVIDFGLLSLYAIATGSTICLLWLAIGSWQVGRLRAHAQPAPPEMMNMLTELVADGQMPELGVVSKLSIAAAVGLWRPMVLLPDRFIELANPQKLKTVLAHELAHIRHRDLWLLTLLRGLLLVLWPHPLYWLWRRSVRLDQETLADAAAADVTNRANYAEQLVAWAHVATGAKTPRLASSVGLWESPSQLKRRVAILLDERLTVLRSCSRRWCVGSAISLLTVAAGLSLVTLTPPGELLAEVKSEKETQTESMPDADSGRGTLLVGGSPADFDEERLDGKLDFVVSSPPADFDSGNSRTTETETSTDTTALSVEDIAELKMPQYKRLHKIMKPNTIRGICMDENGQPLAGVPVQIFMRRIDGSRNNPDPILETNSDTKGEFIFSSVIDVAKEFPKGLPDEHFLGTKVKILMIQGRVEGRVPGIGSKTVVDIARHGSSLVWVMSPAKVLRGRVMDSEGQPVVGAQVAVGYFATQGSSHGIHTATTDVNGEYVIDDLPAYDLYGSNQVFLVKHPKYAARRVRIINIPGKLDVRLAQGSVIEGRVKFPVGEQPKTVAGNLVRLQRVLPQLKPGKRLDPYRYQIEATTVDETGQYRFESLPAGKYHLMAEVEGWVTQGVENVEVAQGETATTPDILLRQGGRVRVQLIDDKTGAPMRFEQPTKGYINPQQRPQRAGIFFSRNNIVEFSTDGIGEIQLAAGQYAFLISIPLADGGDWISERSGNVDEWPTYEVVDGKLLKILTRLRVQKRPRVATGTLSLYTSPASDESSEDETPKNTFVPATPPAEESEAGDK